MVMKKQLSLHILVAVLFIVMTVTIGTDCDASSANQTEKPEAKIDGVFLSIAHHHDALVVLLSNSSNKLIVVNSRLSTGGPAPEITLTIRKGRAVYAKTMFGTPAPLREEDYVELLPSKSVGVLYFDEVLIRRYSLDKGCYFVRAAYLEQTHLVKSFIYPLVSNKIEFCVK